MADTASEEPWEASRRAYAAVNAFTLAANVIAPVTDGFRPVGLANSTSTMASAWKVNCAAADCSPAGSTDNGEVSPL